MNSDIFEKLSPTKLFFRCALPSMVTMAFGALYQICDGIFVGRFVGQDALAAINLIMPIIMTVFAFSNMIATGASVRVSIFLGEKNYKEASKVFSYSLKVIFIISIILGVFGYIFAPSIIRILSPGATKKAIEYGIVYLRIHSVFFPLLPLYFATDNFLRVCGKETLSMWISVATQSLNIILDIFLIACLGFGIGAAALTTCISMAAGSVITLLLFTKNRLDLHYTNQNMVFKKFIKILANGSSELFSNISMSVMSIIQNFFLLKYGGTTAVAAFSVIMYVDSIVGMLTFGMCDSLQPALSYCYGANLFGKVKALFKHIIIGAVVLSAVSLLFMYFIGPYAARLFVKPTDTNLLLVSVIAMKFFSYSYITGWVDMCFSSFFTALEKPARSLATSFFGTFVFPVMFLFVLSHFWKLNGVWAMPFVSSIASAILTLCLARGVKIQK